MKPVCVFAYLRVCFFECLRVCLFDQLFDDRRRRVRGESFEDLVNCIVCSLSQKAASTKLEYTVAVHSSVAVGAMIMMGGLVVEDSSIICIQVTNGGQCSLPRMSHARMYVCVCARTLWITYNIAYMHAYIHDSVHLFMTETWTWRHGLPSLLHDAGSLTHHFYCL